MAKVAIGAGHGRHTPGKRTPDGEREWTFNNKVVVATIKYLNEYEDVQILRLDDPTGERDVPLRERTDKANRWNADILISVHHNAFQGRWGSHGGTTVFTYVGRWPKAERLAGLVLDRIVKVYGVRNRGLKKANFHMLRESKAEAILIEGAFMDSTIDIRRIRDDEVLDAVGKAIAEAVAEYFGLKKKAAPPPPPKDRDGTLYRVQVGAFSKRQNADELADELRSRGFDAYINLQDQGRKLYRVQAGAFANRQNAEDLAKELRDRGYDVFISQNK